MVFDLFAPPKGPRGRGTKNMPLNMAYMWVTLIPNLVDFWKMKFLTPNPQYPQVPPLGHDPGDRMKILFDVLYIFHLWKDTQNLV